MLPLSPPSPQTPVRDLETGVPAALVSGDAVTESEAQAIRDLFWRLFDRAGMPNPPLSIQALQDAIPWQLTLYRVRKNRNRWYATTRRDPKGNPENIPEEHLGISDTPRLAILALIEKKLLAKQWQPSRYSSHHFEFGPNA